MTKTATYYPERESKTLEFKSTLPAFSSLLKTCVAFANTAGGQLIIGVEDGTRKIIGVSDHDRERLYEDFPHSLYDNTNTGLFAHIYERNFNAHSVMVVEVPLCSKRPCFIKKDGIPKGVYLRVGASTRRAQQVHVEELMRESKHLYFDEEPTQAVIEDLSASRLKQCYGESYSNKKLEAEGVIVSSTVTPKRFNATVSGVLMFSNHPERTIPEASILCTQFAGTQGRKIIQTRELLGPIPQLVNESMALLQNWLQRDYQLQGPKMIGHMPIPEDALRETIINGLMHRKYSIPGALKIALYDDRLEVFSPGALPGLVDINNLGDGTTYLRNPHVAKLARRFRLVEKLGTGIKEIFEQCKKMGIKKPLYSEDGDFVKVTFFFAPDIQEGESHEDAIIKYVAMKGEITIGEVMNLLEISRNTATRKLNNLISQGLLTRKGHGPAVRYTSKK